MSLSYRSRYRTVVRIRVGVGVRVGIGVRVREVRVSRPSLLYGEREEAVRA